MIDAEAVHDVLTLRNRAYQVLYALGFKPSIAASLRSEDAPFWIALAQEVLNGRRDTGIHVKIAEKCNPVMLRYITTGKMSRD